MRVLLIDADSTIPNIALMKLSAYCKSQGHETHFIRLNLPYYPYRKKVEHDINNYRGYDLKCCSVIFDNNINYIKGDDIVFGGTGCKEDKPLPDEIESMEPDYSLYPENDISYGFITRGCIRNCYFCRVPKKEGAIRQVNKVSDIVRHKKVKFMDNNILALSGHEKILEELVTSNLRCSFFQGLDIRLLTEENSFLLSKMNYDGEYIFAFDSFKYEDSINKKVHLLSWAREWQIKMYLYCNPNMELFEHRERIEWCKKRKILPYFMRDISCWDSSYNHFYTDLAAWCNQPSFFKTMDFDTFLSKRHTKQKRIEQSSALYYSK